MKLVRLLFNFVLDYAIPEKPGGTGIKLNTSAAGRC
jgi:hypothetical protein